MSRRVLTQERTNDMFYNCGAVLIRSEQIFYWYVTALYTLHISNYRPKFSRDAVNVAINDF